MTDENQDYLDHEANNRIDWLKENGYKNQRDYERQENFRRACMEYEAKLARGY